MERHQNKKYIRSCSNCGGLFTAARSHAEYCSTACRVAYGRRAQRDDLRNIQLHVDRFQEQLAMKNGMTVDQRSHLTKIAKQIENMLAEYFVIDD